MRAGVRAVGADAAQVLVDQVLELGPPPLEAGRGHVGDVVGDHFDVGLLRLHPGAGDIERAHWSDVLLSLRSATRRAAVACRSPICCRSASAWMNWLTNWNCRSSSIIRVISSTGCTLESSIAPCTMPGDGDGAVGVSARNSVSPSAAQLASDRSARTTPILPSWPFSLDTVPSPAMVICVSVGRQLRSAGRWYPAARCRRRRPCVPSASGRSGRRG